ncbi:chitin synthase chs-1-like isoform X1 [Hypomesus transpacificus]|uniref:chitin synthase chs-1-like isoform X1 n=1 Tax=Hypomesus transpacificus TaxID=137520 RepID=UPI001F0769FA|nr:chitin synthase chs-1-like isoform X1 [Hypomesus transpacificus]
MAELRDNLRKRWDVCRDVPPVEAQKTPWKLVKVLRLLSIALVAVLVFGLAVGSKSFFLVLITLSSNVTHTVPAQNKPLPLLCVSCAMICPSVLLLIKSLWKFIFKNSQTPKKVTALWVVVVESLVGLGSAVLTVMAMPHFGIVTNAMILNSLSLLSSVLQVAAQSVKGHGYRYLWPSILSIVLTLAGYVLFIVSYLLPEGGERMELWVGLAIGSALLVSLTWWQNYFTLFNNSFLDTLVEDMENSRTVVHILSSVVRILVTGAVVGAYVPLSGRDWSALTSVEEKEKQLVLTVMAIQVGCAAVCHWFAVVACKMHALRHAFVLPLHLASIAVLAVFLVPISLAFKDSSPNANYTFTQYCADMASDEVPSPAPDWFQGLVMDVTRSLCLREMSEEMNIALIGSASLCWWLGLVLSTVYILFMKVGRIERTQDFFVRRMYEGAFLEQSLLLNTRFVVRHKEKKRSKCEKVNVFLCATMWHESYDEMIKMFISMFRLDKYRPKDNSHQDVEFESHVYFDDAFVDVKGSRDRHVNEYVETLVDAIREVYTIFLEEDPSIFRDRPPMPDQLILRTPYGGRLEYSLPQGNKLIIHLKDKKKIRHKKRWSQIMYLYYILGWRLTTGYFKKLDKGEPREELEKSLKKQQENTYLLALDGDTDFQPAAVMLLVDRLRLYSHVGAACGRIHPTGTGPMVWYQKFEYAVGHWLQKTAEHVLGCVLCSPGCFSLFRGAALMDDNVMKKYTITATEAGHYVQYDQGEDRWLCTLLLQQGWRVEYNAASDAYTNAPQDFKEFYNQRRRWGPSTMANTLDLLGTGSVTSEKNSSISKPFVLYQILSMAASILGPATICLMTAGSFSFVFNIHPNDSLFIAVVPPTIYFILCFKLKSDTQITIAAVMSVFYAFLMLGTGLSIVGSMVEEQTIWTPSGLFIICTLLLYTITAILHPQEAPLAIYGLLYFICIPSAYLLLAIYSMVNMNNVSWGTRETAGAGKQAAKPPKTLRQRLLQGLPDCCRCPCLRGDGMEMMPEETVVMGQEVGMRGQETDVKPQENTRYLESPPPFLEQCWVTQLQTRTEDYNFKEEHLQEEEEIFFIDLQKRYLEPLKEDKVKQDQITNDLKDLRNKVTFVYFICNALWLVATFFLQLIGSSVTIKIPKASLNLTATGEYVYIDPIGLMFLLGFGLLILIQFLAMLYHRIYTMIHFVAFVDTESQNEKKSSKYKPPKRPEDTAQLGEKEKNNMASTEVEMYRRYSTAGTMV